MDRETKQQHEDLAQYAEERVNELLERALEMSKHGPQAVDSELRAAGALIAVAVELRKRAK
jgi:CelD/BcsL family acetyltransferase involved in cellulose biosynthesis